MLWVVGIIHVYRFVDVERASLVSVDASVRTKAHFLSSPVLESEVQVSSLFPSDCRALFLPLPCASVVHL